jgi:uncharacterized protein YjbI with pentapeptide repeats
MPPVSSSKSLVTGRLTQAEVDEICAKHDRLWSSKPGGARAVFAWKDIQGLDLRGRNLCDADFTGAAMTKCQLQGSRLDNATLFGADLEEANLTDASLRRADLRASSMRNADLTGADLFEADLREGTLAAADREFGFRRLETGSPQDKASELQGAILAGANLERSRLSGAWP